MNCLQTIVRVVLLISWMAAAGRDDAVAEESRPNIVVILADDLGIECLATYGGTSYETPNLDRLATQGMQFTHAFSNPLCSPSRAKLLTGRYSFRNGVPIVIYDPQRHADTFLRTDQPSFARQLKQAGYATAIAGKWQLSFLDRRNEVREFGFDEYQLWQIFAADGKKTRRFHQPHLNRNGTVIADQIKHRYGPEVNVEFLLDFMKSKAQTKQPFLAYYTCLLPHYPWVPTPDSDDQNDPVKTGTDKGNTKFFPDMVKYLDKNVGRIMSGLDEFGVADNTVLVFLADNGTDGQIKSGWGEHKKKIQGGKGTMTDRGTRVPLIVRWPGHVEPGSICDDLVDFSDMLPTLCDLSGAPLPSEKIHGRSFAPQLLGQPGSPRQWVHYQNGSQRQVRSRDFLLNNRGNLRPVVEIGAARAAPLREDATEVEKAGRAMLEAAFASMAE